MRHYFKYFGLSLITFAFYIIIDVIDRHNILKFALVALFIIGSVWGFFQWFEWLSVYGQGAWKMIKALQKTTIN